MELTQYQTLNTTEGHSKTSDKYAFIPTTRVISQLESYGWYPSKVVECRTRKENRVGFQKHMIRMRHNDFSIEDVGFPELLLTNSHMGNSSFKIELGLFRMVCSNGLVAGDVYQTSRINHVGFAEEEVYNAAQLMAQQAPTMIEDVNVMRQIELNPIEQKAYAEAVIDLAFDGEKYSIAPENLLAARRYADGSYSNDRDLFTTFNVVQENVIKGGYRMINKETRDRRRARRITGLNKDVKLNSIMWKLANTVREARLQMA